MRIIDFHTHPYLTEEENICMYKDFLRLSMQEVKADLQSAGITGICGSVISAMPYNENDGFASLRELNRKALEIREAYGDFYIPGFHIHPAFVEESLEEMAFMYESGVRLIGELVPYIHGWAWYGCDYDSDGLHKLLDAAGRYHMAVSYHTMTEQQEQMTRMIKAHSDVIFIAAHPGGREVYLQHLERLTQYRNAFLDLSGTGLFRYGMLRTGVEMAGADKLIFGTDYPICNPRMYVQAVVGEHLPEEDTKKIFYKNVEDIFANCFAG
ncbi:MAG: amidohydrolase [Lachnospiraceae bacterium]|nr:TatD family hydrolase [uncultured Acetatifactor sp.]MCI8287751.1 amidohydrolase [Lachnospiraceae bacterium]